VLRQEWCAVTLAFAGAAVGCDVNGVNLGDFEASEPFAYELPASNRSRFRLDGINGAVTVTGDVNATTISIEGERRVRSSSVADAEVHLAELQVQVNESPDDVHVETIQPSNPEGRTYEVDYRIVLPGGFDVDIDNANGAIEVRFVAGDLVVDGVNGEVVLGDVSGDVGVRVVNGQIAADLDPIGTPAVRLGTVNGRIDLMVPATVSAVLTVQVVNGTIDISNLTTTDVTRTANRLQATLGTGSGLIDLETINGAVHVLGR